MLDIFGNEKGIVLVACLVILCALWMMGAAAIHTTVTDTKLSGNVREIKQSFFLAEAGLSHGGEYLMQNLSEWEHYGTSQVLIHQTSLGSGHYQVSIEDAGGDRARRLISTGTSNGGTKTEIEAVLVPDYSAQQIAGLFGCEGVELNVDATTQSYSSSGQSSSGDEGHIGTADADAEIVLLGDVVVHGDAYGTNEVSLGERAVIAKNGYANGAISMSGESSIGGDAETGGLCAGCVGRVGKSIKEYASPPPVEIKACDPLDVRAIFAGEAHPIATKNDNAELSPDVYDTGDGSFFIGGSDTSALGAAGEQRHYYFSSFTMDSDARITVQGDARLYVSGDFLLLERSILNLDASAKLTVYASGELFCSSHSQINNPGRPQDFTLYSDYPSSDKSDFRIRLNSNADLTAVVYAPETAIEINSGANVFGSIRGKCVYMPSNTAFWYDEDLTGLVEEPAVTSFDVVLKRLLD